MDEDDRTRIAPAPVQARVGTQLSGVYELDEKLGSGGMGEVWRGHNIQTGDSVAIKIVLPEFARDQTILQLFRKEALILNRLSHDAIVRYHLFTVDPVISRPYLAMEFVEGESLFDVMRRGPLPVTDARRLCLRLAGALAAVHEASVFHRDLSPDNIILPDARVERAKIIDFGIARSTRLGDATLIGGRFAGKYNYVSPEQLGLFGGEISARSDIYSLGLVLAAALRGEPIDMNGSQWEVVEKRRSLPDLSGVDVSFVPLLSAMLRPDPRDRLPTMDAVVEAARAGSAAAETRRPDELIAASEKYGIYAAPATDMPASFVPHRSPALPSKTPPPRSGAGKQRSRAVAGTGVLLVLLIAGAGAYYAGLLPLGPLSAPGSHQEPPPRSGPEPPSTLPGSETNRTPDANRSDQESNSADVREPADRPPEIEGSARSPDKHVPPMPDAPDEPAQAGAEEVKQEDVLPPPADVLDGVAERIAWLRGFSGGDCFYATATTATDKAIEIEGFGTGVEPFAEMMAAFQARFGIEPEIGVRLIDAAQCPVTSFLRELGDSGENAPQLILARTSVANGATLSGSLSVRDGGAFHLFLIDHKGIAFNLDKRVERRPDGAGFEIPIALSAADRAGAKSVPQVILAVTSSGGDLKSASIDRPMPAGDVLAAITAEARSRKIGTAAAAKYFRLGG